MAGMTSGTGSRIPPALGVLFKFRFGGISLLPVKISSPNLVVHRKWGPTTCGIIQIHCLLKSKVAAAAKSS